MAKIFTLRAPAAMKLHKMSEREIEAYVEKEAGRMLEQLPTGVRAAGVNAVAIDSLVKATAADPGVWAQWTRACCDKSRHIDDFVNPVIRDFDPAAEVLRPQLASEHVESLLRTETLSYPQMHAKTKAPAKARTKKS